MQKHKVWFRLLRAVVHIGVVLGSFWITYLLRLQTDLIPGVQIRIPQIHTGELMTYALIGSVLFFVIGIYQGFYQLFVPFAKNYRKLLKVWVIWFVIMTFIAYFGDGYIFQFGISRLILLRSALLMLIVLVFVEWGMIYYEQEIEKKDPTTMLFVYVDKKEYESVQEEMLVKKYSKIDAVNLHSFDKGAISNYDNIIVIGSIEKDRLQEIYDVARIAGKKFFHIAQGFFLEDVIYTPEKIGNIMSFEYKATKLDGWAVVLKRLMDIVGSSLGIVLFSPVFLLVAILIKIDSQGPILYKQQRVGRNGNLFTFIKFRSMFLDKCVGDEYGGKKAQEYREKLISSDKNIRKGELQKIENDPRVTRIGRILRRLSLDELPNLFSVFVGDMSLVGPRPHLESEIAKYKSWHKRLLSAKPGITGYSQVHGRDALTFDQEAYFDLTYIQQWSIALDLYVILKTIKVVFLKSDR